MGSPQLEGMHAAVYDLALRGHAGRLQTLGVVHNFVVEKLTAPRLQP